MARHVQLISRGMDQLLHDRRLAEHLHGLAEQVAARARGSAPVDSGTFRDSIHVQDAHTDRVVARVVTTDPKGAIKEARFRTLTRALRG